MKLIIFLISAAIAFSLIFMGFLYFNHKVAPLPFNKEEAPSSSTSIIQEKLETPTAQENLNSAPLPQKPINAVVITTDQIKMLYPTKKNGRVWYAKWSDGNARTLKSGQSDLSDLEFVARGNGIVSIDGKGIAHLQGASPRMYVLDPAKNKKWNNVEATVYAKRLSESGVLSSQGIVIGARSEHQGATKENPCLGRTYYGRLLYDGRAVFQKEVIHEGAYSVNKPGENNKALWDSTNGTLPRNKWIGVKFIVKTNSDKKSVKLELYRDLTDGKNGGKWDKIAEYTDLGEWSQTDLKANVKVVCGYPASKVLLDPGTSVFIRNDNVKDVEYKLFSIREIK